MSKKIKINKKFKHNESLLFFNKKTKVINQIIIIFHEIHNNVDLEVLNEMYHKNIKYIYRLICASIEENNVNIIKDHNVILYPIEREFKLKNYYQFYYKDQELIADKKIYFKIQLLDEE